MLSANCTICFKSGNTFSLTEKINKDGINETLKFKLCYFVPEVEWLDRYYLCDQCVQDLLVSCKFKEKCLNFQSHLWQTKNEINIDYSEDLKLEYHSDGGSSQHDHYDDVNKCKLFICYLCNGSFEQKIDLVKHFEDVHNKIDITKHKRKEICASCGRRFTSVLSLNEHMCVCDGIRRHSKSKADYQCDKCGKYYTTQKILRAHKLKCNNDPAKETKHQCTKCNKFYISEKTLKQHEKEKCRKNDVPNELVENRLYCKICDEPVNTNFDLEKHLSAEHNSVLLSCNRCNQFFVTKDELQSHKEIIHKTKRSKFRKFSCEICRQQFCLLKDIINHCSNVHSMNEKAIKPYECEICYTRLKTSSNLLNHKLYHDRNRTNICSFCGKSFITKNDLACHEIIHYDTRKYKCNKCDKSFKTNTNLRTHQLIVHTDPLLWKHICDICGKRFPQKSNFDQHRRRHLGEKFFSCQLCDKSFASKGELQGHMKGHLNVQAYRCEHCGKAYRKKHTYNVHMTKIHGIGNTKIRILEKKHACHICPGKFVDKIKLTRHLCTHTGIKPYSCNICDKKFIDKSYLKHHLRTVHKVDVPRSENSPTV